MEQLYFDGARILAFGKATALSCDLLKVMDTIDHYVEKYKNILDRYREVGAVIGQPWGGLGDNLSFSTLPERFSEAGIACFVSTENRYRNSEINDLVWKQNPYVKGFVAMPPNAGCAQLDVFDKLLPASLGFIERIELAHGLMPRNSCPKIFYVPKIRADLADKIIIDVGSVSVAAPMSVIIEYVNHIVFKYKYSMADLRQARFGLNVATKNTIDFKDIKKINIKSIFDYCDILASVKCFMTVHSGAQSLAVAVKAFNPSLVIHAYATPMQYNWRNYIYKSVEYFVK